MLAAPVPVGMYDAILVATDGSDHAHRAARHAEYIADAFGADLSLVTAVDPAAAAGPFSAGGVDEAYRERLRDAAQETVREAAAALDGAPHTAVRLGRPSECVLSYADELGADLIVAGTQGRAGLRRHVTGSVAERLVTLADVPVVTTRAVGEGPVGAYHDLLIATDGSVVADAATDHVLAVAQRTEARVHAITAVHADGPAIAPDPPADRDSGAEATVERVTDRARDAGIDAVGAVVEGRPAPALLEYATEHAVDLVAVGRTGSGGLSAALLGSTTDRVLRRSDAPVLTAGTDDRA